MTGDANMCVLAIDLGTSNVKVAVVDEGGAILGRGQRSIAVVRYEDGGAEQDAHAIWEDVKAAARDALAASGAAERVAAVMCSSQYSSIVPVDRDGQPLMNLIVWMDTRGGMHNLMLYGQHPDAVERWIEIHGCPPTPSGNDSLAHMLWVKAERPDVYERTHAFLEPMDFVNAQLTGRCCANQCSTFMMLLTDNRTLDAAGYDSELVAFSGLDPAKLPELLPVGAEIGALREDVARELGLSPDTRVFGAVNDTQAGSVATATFQGDHAGVCVGTTSVLLASVDAKRTDFQHALLSMPSPIRGRYMAMAENGLGAKVLEHFLNNIVFASDPLGELVTADVFAALDHTVAAVPPGSNGVLFLPWLNGSGSPAFNGNARGGFLNMSLETTRADMARAVLEGVAYNMRWLVGPVQEFVGQTFNHFVFAGGGACSDQWAQIFADVLQAPVHQLADARYVNARGTALLAFHYLGRLSLAEVAERGPVARIFEPRAEHAARYTLLFRQFVAAYEQNSALFEALNG